MRPNNELIECWIDQLRDYYLNKRQQAIDVAVRKHIRGLLGSLDDDNILHFPNVHIDAIRAEFRRIMVAR